MTTTTSAIQHGVSYVVPVYNKRPFLPAMLAGLKAQRGDFPREFIFVDDGSTDGSAELLAKLTVGWADIRIFEQPNRGPAVATNRGLGEARLPLIKLVDGDDVLLPDATLLLRDMLRQYPQAVAAYGRVVRYEAEAEALAQLEQATTRAPPRRLEDALPILLRQTNIGPTDCLIRAATVRAVGGCDRRVFTQDYSLLLRLATQGPFVGTDAVVGLSPREAPERINDGGPQVLHDCNLTLLYFLRDYDLPAGLAGPAIRRALTRALLWARRREQAGLLSRWGLMRLLAELPLPPLQLTLLRHSTAAFTLSRPVRRAEG